MIFEKGEIIMKLFIGILFAAAILGGFAGSEISDTPFSITGMIIGGVSIAAVLLGLGPRP